MTYDVIVRNGLWFDGTGARPQRGTLGIRDGVVAAVSTEPLDETGCPDVIDADGMVLTPRARAYADVGEAELGRLAGRNDPGLWTAAAQAWEHLSEPYAAAYARWREAEAILGLDFMSN